MENNPPPSSSTPIDPEHRRPQRENAGVPPSRYGTWEDGKQRPNPIPRSKTLSVSSSTSSATRQKQEAELQFLKRQAEIDEEIEAETSRLRQETLEQLRKKESRMKEILEKEKALQLSKIDDEFLFDDNERFVPSIHGGGDNDNHVDDWVDKSQHNRAPSPTFNPDLLADTIAKILQQTVQFQQDSQKDLIKDLMTSQKESIEKLVTAQSESVQKLREPKDLPTFDGNPEDWLRFFTTYTDMTQRRKINNSDNLNRLQKALKGRALAEVRHLMVHPDNVPQILERLKERFGREDLIIEQLVARVQRFKKLKLDPPDDFVEFCSTIRDLVTTVENLSESSYLHNKPQLKEFCEKLPETIRAQWAVHSMSLAKPGLKEFSVFLSVYSKGFMGSCKNTYVPEHNAGRRNRVAAYAIAEIEEPEEQTFIASESANYAPNPSPRICTFCKQDGHLIYGCVKFKEKKVSERVEAVKQLKLCFNCLGTQHGVKDCKSKKCKECGKPHHTLLHFDQAEQKYPQPQKKSNLEPEKSPESVNSIGSEFCAAVWLKILPVILRGPKGEIHTYAFLDEGSTVTLIQEELATQLGLSGPREDFGITTVEAKNTFVKSRLVQVEVRGVKNTEYFLLEKVRTHANMHTPIQSVDPEILANYFSEEELSDIPAYKNVKPGIIIGIKDSFLKDNPSEPVVRDKPKIMNTRIGKCAFGPVPEATQSHSSFFVGLTSDQCDLELYELVKRNFEFEAIGVHVPKEKVCSKEEKRALNIMENTTKRIDGGWETGLLWKCDKSTLPDNRETVLKRLYSIERKMDRDYIFAEKYMAKMEEYFSKGFARPIRASDSTSESLWYLPHFNAHNPKKPDKVRIVFDAAAKCHGVSLNDNLLKGPDFYNSLPDILLKFRQYEVGVIGDIKDFFPRIKIIPNDQNSQRFFYRGMDRTSPPKEFVMESMIFGATCSPSSAQFVRDKNALEFESKYPTAVRVMKNSFFVDDFMTSGSRAQDVSVLLNGVIEICGAGGFTICNVMSNSQQVLNSIPCELVSSASSVLLSDDNQVERVLGLYWNPSTDTFTFTTNFVRVNPHILSGIQIPTKRDLLKLIASIFDPLGFIAHFVIKAKILQRELWCVKVDWDEEIPNHLLPKWIAWLEELQLITEIRISRCYDPEIPSSSSMQLHVFVDASELAYAACVFLRVCIGDRVQVSLVMAKARVSPVKLIATIPKLELQAAVLGSRLTNTIQKALDLKIQQVHYWSDSTTVLSWLRTDSRKYKIFVSNRVSEIEENTVGSEWHWVPTKENVADEATRDIYPTNFDPGSRWFCGPEFLQKDPEFWPREPESSKKPTDLEMKQEYKYSICEVKPFLDYQRFSKWSKLVRVIAWILRLKRVEKPKELTLEELNIAEKILLKLVQSESFPIERKFLEEEKTVSTSNRLYSLSPILTGDGLLRVKGRLIKSPEVPLESKCPIILDPHHRVTKLLIQHYHELCFHQGQETVLNELKKKFWILNARSAVRRAFKDCVKCQIDKPKPIFQEMGELPEGRVTKTVRAFINVGLDYFGPLLVIVGRRNEKRWVALFTCMVTRAIHLELVHSLDTDSAIMAIRRFCARRGSPDSISSDNGTNFHGANNELREALKNIDEEKVKGEFVKMKIHWNFIPPSAPNMGGAWERLVQSVKTALYSTLKDKKLLEELLRTVLCEVEFVVNSRPITYVSLDPNDGESLTPNHFLIGKRCEVTIPTDSCERDLLLRKYWKQTQFLADEFWRKWVLEYLPTLTKRKKWIGESPELKVGDLVFIADGGEKRGTWPKGVIVGKFPGKDGKVRVYDVKTSTGVYRRAVSKLLVPSSNME